jgi:hypothetical protein
MRPERTEKRMARFIQGDRPEAGAELAMTGWKLARLFLGVALIFFRARYGGPHSRQPVNLRDSLAPRPPSLRRPPSRSSIFGTEAYWSPGSRRERA